MLKQVQHDKQIYLLTEETVVPFTAEDIIPGALRVAVSVEKIELAGLPT